MLNAKSSENFLPNMPHFDILRWLGVTHSLTHSLTAVRNRLWVVAPSMLTGRRREPMRQCESGVPDSLLYNF